MAKLKGKTYAFLISFVAAIGGFLFGYDLAVIAGANILLRNQFNLSDAAFGFATSSASLGCIVGPFLGAWLCDWIGRKRTLIIASVILAISAIITALAPDINTFNIFRIVGGVGVGLCSIASTMYIAELAPPSLRGRLMLMYQVAVIVGALISGIIAFFLVKSLADDVSWRWMFASEMVAILIFVAFLFILPLSPRWLAKKHRFDEALSVLTTVAGAENAEVQLREIKESITREEQTAPFRELFKPGIRMALLVGVLLAIFNNYTGFSGMSLFLPTLYQKGGFSETSDAIFQFVLTYGFMGLMTIVSMWFIDRFGRRPLWNFSSILMIFATFVTGLVFHYQVTGFLVIVVIFLCTIPHALALGGLPWVMISEIFPTAIRAKAVGLVTTVLWATIFSGGFVFPIFIGYSEKLIGSAGGVFWLFSIICVFSLIFGLKLLPETKGRTLEEIAESWEKN